MLDTPREWYQARQGKIDTSGLDPVLATVLRLAGDGLWLTDQLGLVSLDSEQRAATPQPSMRNDRQRRLNWGMKDL